MRTRGGGAQAEQMSQYCMPMAPPPPLTPELLNQAMVELGPGSAHAVQACYDCYNQRTMSAADLIAFVRSISSQSVTLRRVFAPQAFVPGQSQAEVASNEDFAFLMAAYGNAPAGPPQHATGMRHVAPKPAVALPPIQKFLRAAVPAAPVPAPLQRVEFKMEAQDSALAPSRPAPRVRRSTHTEPSPEETRLMIWWTDRRGPEVQRRQRETVANAHIRARSPTSALLILKFRELSVALPTAGKASLLVVVRGANAGRMSDAAVAEGVQKLVDDYNVTVLLTHKFECNVRAAPPPSWRTNKKDKGPAVSAVAVHDVEDDDDDDEVATSILKGDYGPLRVV